MYNNCESFQQCCLLSSFKIIQIILHQIYISMPLTVLTFFFSTGLVYLASCLNASITLLSVLVTRWIFYLCLIFVLIISHHSELLPPALMQLFLPKYTLLQNKRSKLKKLRRHRQLMKFTRSGKLREL